MTRVLANYPITEDFADSEGRWIHYEAYDAAQRTALGTQRHVDLASFRDEDDFGPRYVNDSWVGGTLGPQADRNGWPGLTASCSTGNHAITATYARPVDLLNGFDSSAVLSLACPAFPLANVSLSLSTVKLIDSDGNNYSVAFSASSTGAASGDTEVRLARSLFEGHGVDLSSIASLVVTINASSNCTFRMVGIRLIALGWAYAPLDTNTQAQALVNPPTLTGTSSRVYGFPTGSSESSLVPDDFPIMLRAATPSGVLDPRPVDVTLQCGFFTGSKSDINTIRLFLREFPAALVTQLDLDDGITQLDLEALGHQPDYTDGEIAAFSPRTQADMDGLTQGELDGRLQSDLERFPNSFYATWEEVQIIWGVSGDSVVLQDTEGNDYHFGSTEISLAANTFYYAVASLDDSSFRLRIYPVLGNGNFDAPVFDSGVIADDTIFIRRRGRVGWYAQLRDGNSYITEVRAREVCFGEYRSHPLASITPISGLQLFASCSSHRELFTGLEAPAGITNSTVVADNTKSQSGRSWKILNNGVADERHIVVSNEFEVSSFENLLLRFSLNFPTDAIAEENPLFLRLSYRGAKDSTGVEAIDEYSYDIALPQVIPDFWQDFQLEFGTAATNCPSGRYVLAFSQATTGDDLSPTAFYLDNISLKDRVVSWSARPDRPDPWGFNDIGWLPFKEAMNSATSGIVFSRRGLTPQVRARAHQQNAIINRIQVKPKKAELGRLVWKDQAPPTTTLPPTTDYTTDTSALAHGMKFLGTTTPDTGNEIVLLYWSFGDGTVLVGADVEHAFPRAGDWAATFTAVDNVGSRGIKSQIVTVT